MRSPATEKPGPIPALASVIGRDTELDALRRQLRNPALRLLTVTGPPGVGKSRLVAALYPDLRAEFGDGVRFADLAAEPYPPGRPDGLEGLDGLAGGDRELLLVIDHGDRVLAELTRAVTKLLACRRGLRVVLCCREPARVYGERLFPLHPLQVPGPHPPDDLTELGGIASVRLLLDRATATRPDLVLTPDNRQVITELSDRLDGLPLAIELAAARLRLFHPLALLNRLRSGLDILYGNAPHRLSHHRSMSAAIAWTYESLAEHERRLLRRLAVLDRGFDLAAAESAGDLDGGDLHDALQRLAERGLLAVADHADGEPHFTLLNTIRMFALEETAGSTEPAPPSTGEPGAGLTRREHQVAVLVAQGLTNRQIARRLGIAEWTAVNHVRNVMRKLDCSSRVHVAGMISHGREFRQVSGR
ncbi:hypothetical protein Aph01nite_05490 [Acrocarpospora phusangensis]|uniref:HTH luxR-type domain-containing protein n=1 Tax=Acrocarpospora phusangensis TaxID=1070424 RepID=A0A919Q6Q7_9ACTN|nr:LuxR C-terminal-related transcriptional regulator [Acrocarpospora phusangensis]GIH22239.1 hypothetical protein Aph01nite_05490 [Acrocarpospora phusangensis]